jgi:hypothetical protein
MMGDQEDMAARMKAVLPARWFGDQTPVLDALLAGIGAVWALLYGQVQALVAQTRIATATGVFLDMISADFFGRVLPRRLAEGDEAFRLHIRRELLRERGTRRALEAVLTDLTGRAPDVFEPARPADTGAWALAAGYGAAGGWGSLMLPRQCFVTAYRPAGEGIAWIAGWGASSGGYGAGAEAWGSRAAIAGQVSDDDIAACVAATMPAASIAWLRIEN